MENNYVAGYDPYMKEGSIGSVYIYKKTGENTELLNSYNSLQEELSNYIMYDPYYYQYYIEKRAKLIQEVKNSQFWKWNLNPNISNQEIEGWIQQGKKSINKLIWGRVDNG